MVFLTILLFCLYSPSGISGNTDSDYDEIRILGLCDPHIHADCVEAFTQILSDNDEMATQAVFFNWSVLQASEDLVTGLREMDGVCSKYPYDIMVAFGQTPTMMTAMFTADAFNMTLLAYDTTPGHVLVGFRCLITFLFFAKLTSCVRLHNEDLLANQKCIFVLLI